MRNALNQQWLFIPKPKLGESTLTYIGQDTPNLAKINFSVLTSEKNHPVYSEFTVLVIVKGVLVTPLLFGNIQQRNGTHVVAKHGSRRDTCSCTTQLVHSVDPHQ